MPNEQNDSRRGLLAERDDNDVSHLEFVGKETSRVSEMPSRAELSMDVLHAQYSKLNFTNVNFRSQIS